MAKTKKRIDQIPDHLKLSGKEQRDYLDRHKIKVETLDNGTQFISFNCPYLDKQYTWIDVRFRTGAWDDPMDGLAHFAEHAVFLGCPVAPTYQERVNRPKQGGYKINGTTYLHSTNYGLKASSGLVNPKHYGLLYGLDHFLSTLAEPYLPKEALYNEKKVIIDEYQLNATKLHYMSTHYIWSQILPPDHPQLNYVTGTDKTINNIDIQSVRPYIENAYVPQNAILTVISEGNSLKHQKIANVLKDKWLKTMKDRKGVPNRFPDYEWLCRHQNLDPQKIYHQFLPIKKSRVLVNLVKIIKVENNTKEAFAFDMAFEILRQITVHGLRIEGYGYAPEAEMDYIPFVGLGISQIGIEVDFTKVSLLTTNLKRILQKAIKEAINHDYHTLEVNKKRFIILDSPITYSTRFTEVFRGLYRFNQIVRSEDLDKTVLSVTPSDVKFWLENFAENPGALFIVGDTSA